MSELKPVNHLKALRHRVRDALRYPRNVVLFVTLTLVLSAVVFLGGIAWAAADPEVAGRPFSAMTVGDFFSPIMVKVSLVIGSVWAVIVAVVQGRA